MAIGLLAAFILWTIAVCFVDVQTIGPQQSKVGLATINAFFHECTGVNMPLYILTDWLGLVPLGFAMGFALLGAIQWIKRKRFLKVDKNLLVLGGFYIFVMAAYFFFEKAVVNYRPVLIEGVLEASYPSSTTLLVLCVIPTAMMQLCKRIKNNVLKICVLCGMAVFVVFMVTSRFLAGVHWFSDIIGGGLLSAGLVMLYSSICKIFE